VSLYRGRFAPSPTGLLHFGSLVTALCSYLDTRQHQGRWLLRIEDVDPQREQKGASDLILTALERYHLYWDEHVLYQRQRGAVYEEHCQHLLSEKRAFYCTCSRSTLGEPGQIYPGHCRHQFSLPSTSAAIRFRVDNTELCFNDQLQGPYCQILERDVGDFIIKRKELYYAYQLAVIVDDHHQGITHVVRGIDLLDNTPRQIALLRVFGYPEPKYAHVPLVVNAAGQKLSKQNLALPISLDDVRPTLLLALRALKLNPPQELLSNSMDDIMRWAEKHWNTSLLANQRHLPCPEHLPA